MWLRRPGRYPGPGPPMRRCRNSIHDSQLREIGDAPDSLALPLIHQRQCAGAGACERSTELGDTAGAVEPGKLVERGRRVAEADEAVDAADASGLAAAER